MDDVIGILELVGWLAFIIALSAVITFAMIKIFPGRDQKPGAGPAETGS